MGKQEEQVRVCGVWARDAPMHVHLGEKVSIFAFIGLFMYL